MPLMLRRFSAVWEIRYREDVDAVIIGGGVVGLATAWRLAQQARAVAVWDAARVGTEASWAGAGMLAPGGEMENRTWWGDLAIHSLGQYSEFVRELEDESGIRIDYRRCGALELAATEEEWGLLQARAARQSAWGIRSENAGGQKLFYPDDAAVDPRDLLRALRAACEKRGVTFREEKPVHQIVAQAGLVTRPERAAIAVLAAGAWSSEIQIRVDGVAIALERSFPIRGHLIAFAAGTGTPGPIVRQGHTYILDRSSGITIAGSTTEQVGYLREPNPVQFADIEARARKLMPGLESRLRCDAWIGFRPGTESGEPQLGRLTDSPVYLAYGHYRNGILMAPATADLLARAITANSQTGSISNSAHRESDLEPAGTGAAGVPASAPVLSLRRKSTAAESPETPDR